MACCRRVNYSNAELVSPNGYNNKKGCQVEEMRGLLSVPNKTKFTLTIMMNYDTEQLCLGKEKYVRFHDLSNLKFPQ